MQIGQRFPFGFAATVRVTGWLEAVAIGRGASVSGSGCIWVHLAKGRGRAGNGVLAKDASRSASSWASMGGIDVGCRGVKKVGWGCANC